jgi:CheY-like chemotaxis protein
VSHDVLVIDDSATVRKLVEISLRGRPLRPHFAETGGEGIRCAATLAPSAILLDFMLPDMTAVEVCRGLAADRRTQRIPILVVTAKDERVRAELQQFPAVIDFIAKPFAVADLVARIERAIATAAPRPERDPGERAAQLLYARLRDALTRLPAQLAALEPGPVAPQLARQLLTPQTVAGILADLQPLYAELADVDHAGAAAPTGDAVLDRAPGFAAKVEAAQLSALDRRILALTDGRLPVGEIARRIAVDPAQVARAAGDLLRRGLVHEPGASTRPRPVVIWEPDVDAFHEPLRALLAGRPVARELIAVDQLAEVVDASRRHQPCLVLVNASARTAEACAIAHALRAELGLADVAMVAVLEARGHRPADLLAAGFDAVLAKPVMVGQLERFLMPADLR